WDAVKRVIDDLVIRSNLHTCDASRGCLDKDGICKARFPRELIPKTVFDEKDGRILMKKLESRIN
ncbi:hypothetical protein DFP72DRAFT_748572, partial [Ephemerocybe angulata]